jgi:hypothetical protein
MKIGYVILLFVLVFVLVFALLAINSPTLTHRGRTEHTYVLDHDFDTVRKVFVRNNPLEEIIAEMHGEILESHFDKLDFHVDRIFHPNWEVDGEGYAVIRINDPIQTDLRLRNKIHIDKNQLHSYMWLVHPVNGIQDLQDEMLFYREGDRTRVVHKTSMLYGLPIPRKLHGYMQQEVDKAVYSAPRKAEPAVRRAVNKYAKPKQRGLNIPLGNLLQR